MSEPASRPPFLDPGFVPAAVQEEWLTAPIDRRARAIVAACDMPEWKVAETRRNLLDILAIKQAEGLSFSDAILQIDGIINPITKK